MSRTGPSELEPLVHQFEHLSEKPRAAEALEKLRKIASIVKPLMRQRNWKVGTLAEFWPDEANLLGLNINRGQKICLRLRYPGDHAQFLPFENVVDTMLHELAHIVVGPHNQNFNALWNKLRDEHEALLRKGYTGEGFLGNGRRLGGRRVPMAEARRQARAAAERRKVLTGSSGQKLGGAGIIRGQNPREVIAAAIERRLKIERGCASATDEGRRIAREEELKKEKVTTTTVEQEDENEAALMQAYIELIQEEESQQFGDNYIPPSEGNPAGTRGMAAQSLVTKQKEIENHLRKNRENEFQPSTKPKPRSSLPESSSKTIPQPPLVPVPSATATATPELPETWTCDICTLANPMQYLACDACTTERPESYASPPLRQSSRPTKPTTSNNTTGQTPHHNALQPRLNAVDALHKIEKQAAYKKQQPVGWRCACGNFMEQQWWTCSVCGRMKASS